MISLLLLLHMVNMYLQVEICTHGVVRKVNNNRKPVFFCDVLYHLNAIFFCSVFFRALRAFLATQKSQDRGVPKGTLYLCISNERIRIDLSNGINCSSNKAFFRKLQHKQ
jgi:hypothetical protein